MSTNQVNGPSPNRIPARSDAPRDASTPRADMRRDDASLAEDAGKLESLIQKNDGQIPNEQTPGGQKSGGQKSGGQPAELPGNAPAAPMDEATAQGGAAPAGNPMSAIGHPGSNAGVARNVPPGNASAAPTGEAVTQGGAAPDGSPMPAMSSPDKPELVQGGGAAVRPPATDAPERESGIGGARLPVSHRGEGQAAKEGELRRGGMSSLFEEASSLLGNRQAQAAMAPGVVQQSQTAPGAVQPQESAQSAAASNAAHCAELVDRILVSTPESGTAPEVRLKLDESWLPKTEVSVSRGADGGLTVEFLSDAIESQRFLMPNLGALRERLAANLDSGKVVVRMSESMEGGDNQEGRRSRDRRNLYEEMDT